MPTTALLVLAALVVTVVVAWWWRTWTAGRSSAAAATISYVATARHMGMAGDCAPVGVIEPSGARIAFAEGQRLRVLPIAGGLSEPVAAADGQIRHLAWMAATGELLIEDAGASRRWWIVTPGRTKKRPLWDGRALMAVQAVSEADAAFMRDSQVPIDMSAFATPVTQAAWRTRPSRRSTSAATWCSPPRFPTASRPSPSTASAGPRSSRSISPPRR